MQPIQSTIAKQLANYVVLYSPLQMAADLPENYKKYPAPFQFIKDVPTDWAQTLVPNGEVGDYVTIVRKDRNSDDWYLGSVTDENARTLRSAARFPRPGSHAIARRSIATAPTRTGARTRRPSRSSAATVRRGDTLQLKLAPGGGQAIRFQAVPGEKNRGN